MTNKLGTGSNKKLLETWSKWLAKPTSWSEWLEHQKAKIVAINQKHAETWLDDLRDPLEAKEDVEDLFKRVEKEEAKIASNKPN